MTSRDFCFWLQGYFELSGSTELSEAQVDGIKRHLNLVFIHEIDPSAGPPEHQAELNAAHSNPLKPLRPSGPNGETMRC